MRTRLWARIEEQVESRDIAGEFTPELGIRPVVVAFVLEFDPIVDEELFVEVVPGRRSGEIGGRARLFKQIDEPIGFGALSVKFGGQAQFRFYGEFFHDPAAQGYIQVRDRVVRPAYDSE